MVKVNIQEEIEKINHTRRLFDLLFRAGKIDQAQHRVMVNFAVKQIKNLELVFTQHGKEINV